MSWLTFLALPCCYAPTQQHRATIQLVVRAAVPWQNRTKARRCAPSRRWCSRRPRKAARVPRTSLQAPPRRAARRDEVCQCSSLSAVHSGLAVRTDNVLNLALISFSSLMFAIRESALFEACWGPEGGTRPSAPAVRFLGCRERPERSGSDRFSAGARQWVAKRFPSRGRLLGYLHRGGLAGEPVPSTLVLGLDVALRPVQHRAAHVPVHYVGAPVPGGGLERQRPSGAGGGIRGPTRRPSPPAPAPPAASARPGSPRRQQRLPQRPPGRAVLTCCGSPVGCTAGAGWRG